MTAEWISKALSVIDTMTNELYRELSEDNLF
jgi:hypothetical protein